MGAGEANIATRFLADSSSSTDTERRQRRCQPPSHDGQCSSRLTTASGAALCPPCLFPSCSPVYTDHSRSSACVAPALYRFTQRAIPELAAQHRPQSLPQTTLASPASRSTLERLGRHSRWVHRTPLAGFSGPATHQHQSLRGKPLSSIVSPSPWSAPLPTGHTSPLPSPSTTTNATCRPSTASRSRFPLPGTV